MEVFNALRLFDYNVYRCARNGRGTGLSRETEARGGGRGGTLVDAGKHLTVKQLKSEGRAESIFLQLDFIDKKVLLAATHMPPLSPPDLYSDSGC